MVLLDNFKANVPGEGENNLFSSELLRELAVVGQDIENATQCFTFEELSTGNQRNNQQDLRNCALLNRALPYFNLPPKKMNRTGKAKMMSTRNNNFSNRGQKLKLSVYQKPDESNGNTNFESSGSNDETPVIGIVMSAVLVLGILGFAVFKREDVSNCISKTHK